MEYDDDTEQQQNEKEMQMMVTCYNGSKPDQPLQFHAVQRRPRIVFATEMMKDLLDTVCSSYSKGLECAFYTVC